MTDVTRRLRDSGAHEVVTTLADAVVQLAKDAPTFGEQMMPGPIHADAEERASHPQPQMDVSKAKDHPSEERVAMSDNYR